MAVVCSVYLRGCCEDFLSKVFNAVLFFLAL